MEATTVDRARRRFRFRALAVVLAAMLVPLVAGSAAAVTNKPSITVTAGTPSGMITVTINRGIQQIATCKYGVDANPSAPCTNQVGGSKSTSYTIDLTDASPGDHTVNVTIVLTDGGRSSGSASFTIASPPSVAFARAWGERDGVPGYDPSSDDLFSELVDTNGDGVVSVGDTVRTVSYPVDFVDGTGTYGVVDHVVIAVVGQDTTFLIVAVDDPVGITQYAWLRFPDIEGFTETTNGANGFASSYIDSFEAGTDQIRLTQDSPSHPAEVSATKAFDGDDAWLEVSLS
jgi:hypothetical protein